MIPLDRGGGGRVGYSRLQFALAQPTLGCGFRLGFGLLARSRELDVTVITEKHRETWQSSGIMLRAHNESRG